MVLNMSGFSTNDALALSRTVDCDGASNSNQTDHLIQVYELVRCVDWINKNGLKRVCLQFPDKMLCDSTRIAMHFYASTCAKIYILADTSYGSCCVDLIAASHVEADSLIHFGPSCLSPQGDLPVLYVYDVAELEVTKLVRTVAEVASAEESLILFYDSCFHRYYPTLCDAFSNMDQVIVSSLGPPEGDNLKYTTICGRTFTKLRQEKACGVYVGPDSMTLTNLVLRMPHLKWYHYYNDELNSYNTQTSKFLMKRLHLVEKIKDAQVVGIVVATVAVEGYLTALERTKALCKTAGKKSYILAVGRPNVPKLANFPDIDVFVLVSCSENSLLIDNSEYYKPLVTLFEVELALSGRPWSTSYSLDFRQLLPGGDLHVVGDNSDKDEEGDVSLISGKLRHVAVNEQLESVDPTTGTVSVKDAGTVVESRATEFFVQRSWGGLEQKIGETPVEKAKQGRTGVPIGYADEGLQ